MGRIIILPMILIFCFAMTGCGKSASERMYDRAMDDARDMQREYMDDYKDIQREAAKEYEKIRNEYGY